LKKKHNLYLVEDNAHGTCSKYDGRFLGAFGDIATFSFDHMKNINCGQGGGIAVNNESLLEKFFIHYESGTNRRSFMRKETTKYEWINLGSNYRVSELNAAMLYSQLCDETLIKERFYSLWSRYSELLKGLAAEGWIEIPHLCEKQEHNRYCFFIKTQNPDERGSLLQFLNQRGVTAQFHYIPLHSSKFGTTHGRFVGEDKFTTLESRKIVRLPLYFGMKPAEVEYVADAVYAFYNRN
jgi:dTDP-4-amino-4,6-dideoxygalactose transaminase